MTKKESYAIKPKKSGYLVEVVYYTDEVIKEGYNSGNHRTATEFHCFSSMSDLICYLEEEEDDD